MRSASRALLAPALITASAILVAATLSACTSTQQKAGWERLNSARLAVTADKTLVAKSAGPIEVVRTAVVSSRGQSAVVVTVVNTGSKTVGDLPISVGYRLGSRRVYLNDKAGLAYFGAHLPPVAAHRRLTWVFPTPHEVPRGAKPFARVGGVQSPRASYTAAVALKSVVSKLSKTKIAVKVTNLTDIIQYQLQVYAYARGRGAYVAAGAATVVELYSGETREIELRLVGSSAKARIHVEAIPTILQ